MMDPVLVTGAQVRVDPPVARVDPADDLALMAAVPVVTVDPADEVA
jgi:hypothetical protein